MRFSEEGDGDGSSRGVYELAGPGGYRGCGSVGCGAELLDELVRVLGYLGDAGWDLSGRVFREELGGVGMGDVRDQADICWGV